MSPRTVGAMATARVHQIQAGPLRAEPQPVGPQRVERVPHGARVELPAVKPPRVERQPAAPGTTTISPPATTPTSNGKPPARRTTPRTLIQEAKNASCTTVACGRAGLLVV